MSFLHALFAGKRTRQIAADLTPRMVAVTTANQQDVLGAAQRAVHKVTEKTLGSLDVVPEGPLKGHLVGRYGAVWEVGRGGGHDFATLALDEVRPRANQRVNDALKEATG